MVRSVSACAALICLRRKPFAILSSVQERKCENVHVNMRRGNRKGMKQRVYASNKAKNAVVWCCDVCEIDAVCMPYVLCNAPWVFITTNNPHDKRRIKQQKLVVFLFFFFCCFSLPAAATGVILLLLLSVWINTKFQFVWFCFMVFKEWLYYSFILDVFSVCIAFPSVFILCCATVFSVDTFTFSLAVHIIYFVVCCCCGL